MISSLHKNSIQPGIESFNMAWEKKQALPACSMEINLQLLTQAQRG